MNTTPIWMVGLILAWTIPAYAAESTVVTLDQVIEGALQKSMGISQVHKDYEDKLSDSTEASILDNPELKTDFVNQKDVAGTGVGMELTQPLKFSQLTGARWRYADLLRNTASSEQQYEILKTVNQTTSLYMRVWLLQKRKRLYETSAKDAESMSKLVTASVNKGQASLAASNLFLTDAEKLKADVIATDVELRQARADLTKMTGRIFSNAELQKPNLSTVPKNTEILIHFAQDHSNLRNIAKAQIKAAEARLAIAKQDAALPEISPRLLYARSGNGNDSSFGVGIQLRIPLWNQNDVERQRAHASLASAKSQADIFTSAPPEETIAELQQSAIASSDVADSYTAKILPGYHKSYDLTRSMFRQGQINALEVWQVREKLYQSENEGLQAIVEAFNARGALELELGGKLEEMK